MQHPFEAGVAGLHSRRHEAELRLRSAETNLERLQDVMVQIEGQLAALKRQARQAARYRTLSGRLRAAEAMMLHLRWLHAQEAMAEAKINMAAIEKVVADRTRVQAQASTDQASASAKVPPLRQEEAERAAASHRLTVALESLDAEEERTIRELSQLEARLEQIAQDETREKAQMTDSAAHLERLVEEQTDIRDQEENHQKVLTDEQARVVELEKEADARKAEADEATSKFTNLTAQRESLTQQIASLEMQTSTLDGRIDAASNEHQQLVASTLENPAAREAAAKTEDAKQAAEAAQASYDTLSAAAQDARDNEAEARLAQYTIGRKCNFT